jgi:hypothetical protein
VKIIFKFDLKKQVMKSLTEFGSPELMFCEALWSTVMNRRVSRKAQFFKCSTTISFSKVIMLCAGSSKNCFARLYVRL